MHRMKHNPLFSQSFLIDKYQSPHLIVGGDLNLAAHLALDRSRAVPSFKAFKRSLNRTLNNLQLVNTWRAYNVDIKAYTFYSHPHDSFAHLDYIFCTPIVLANSSKADIHSRPWSDHHIVSFTTSHIGLAPTPYKWCVNDFILTDHMIAQQLTNHPRTILCITQLQICRPHLYGWHTRQSQAVI